jgi:penicillin-binding protein 2
VLLDGLVGVTTQSRGTATGVFEGFPHDRYPIAGKTGTAQVGTPSNPKADTALFAAFGPAHAPEYQVTVVMESSGFGSRSAAPVARKLFDVFAGVVPPPSLLPGGALEWPEEITDQPTQDQLAAQGGQD